MDLDRLRDDLPEMLGRMEEVGYSARYVSGTRCFAKRLLDAAPDLADWDAAANWARSFSGEGKVPHLRNHLAICRKWQQEGILPIDDGTNRGTTPCAREGLCDGLASVIDAYEGSPAAAGKAASSVRCELTCAASFLARLEAFGSTCVDDVTEDDVIEALTDEHGQPAFSASLARHLRAVLSGASDAVPGCARLLSLIPVPREWRKVQPALTPDEAESVAATLSDPESGVSLRDRAIAWTLMLTALRSCDVAALRVDSIEWDRGLVSIVQQKTGRLLELPLPTQVGNAIFEYATRERRRSADPHVFLSSRCPHGPITAHAVRAVARRVLDSAGVCTGGARGSHALRRAAITAMLGAGEDRAVVAAVAGHASAETTDGYMVASVEGLRAHASLDVSHLSPEGLAQARGRRRSS